VENKYHDDDDDDDNDDDHGIDGDDKSIYLSL
jgi:hypothetical protein